MRNILLFLCIISTSFVFAQEQFTISGKVSDLYNGESLKDVEVKANNDKVYTNNYGFFSLTLPKGAYDLSFKLDGYNDEVLKINLTSDIKEDIFLTTNETNISLKEIITKGKLLNKVARTEMGMEKVSVATLNKMPIVFGERDIIKSLQFLPGVTNLGDAQSGFSVRGGSLDQNLILLDEAPVYNAAHLLGFFSTFNSDAVKNVTLYKGTAPAEYGGRLSSVVDVNMKEGNNKNYNVSGGLGLISTRLNVEGPIVKDKASFIVSGRRSYADLILKLDNKFKNNDVYFYDLNAKVNYKINNKNHIYLSGYFGRDVLGMSDAIGIDWGNKTATLRFNRVWNEQLFSNTTLIYSNFDYKIDIKRTDPEFSIISKVEDLTLKQDFNYYPNPNNQWKFGLNIKKLGNIPGGIKELSQLDFSTKERKALETAAYIRNDWKLNDKWNILYGVRLSNFTILKGGYYYNFDAEMNADTLQTNGIIKNYFEPEPRINISYKLNDKQSFKLGYSRNVQNIHLIANSAFFSPSDRWIMNSNIIKPEISNQISFGYFRNLNPAYGEFSIEGFYKNLENQLDFKDGSSLQEIFVEKQLLFGKGRAYGLEFLYKKNIGNLHGWLAYTLSKTEKQINGINNDKWYPAKQDKRHDFSLVAMYKINPKWSISSAYVFQTGSAITFPTGRYSLDGQQILQYTKRNGSRMPDYHRLDISVNWLIRNDINKKSELTFGVYNIYGRENPFFINIQQSDKNPSEYEVNKQVLFKFIPSITWNFKF